MKNEVVRFIKFAVKWTLRGVLGAFTLAAMVILWVIISDAIQRIPFVTWVKALMLLSVVFGIPFGLNKAYIWATKDG